MHSLPHHYHVHVEGTADGAVQVSATQLPVLHTGAPPEFGGPAGFWSPETLLVAAVGDCFVLTFRSVARASKLAFERLQCDVEGVLDRDNDRNRFTRFIVKPHLVISNRDAERTARQCLDRAERACLITHSLNAEIELVANVEIARSR